MTPDEIRQEIHKIVDHSITPGQAFDAICRLRRDQVTFAQVAAALGNPDAPADQQPEAFDGDSLMPFGKYAGTKMDNVPANYLCWLWSQRPISRCPQVEAYIKENLLALKKDHPDGIWT